MTTPQELRENNLAIKLFFKAYEMLPPEKKIEFQEWLMRNMREPRLPLIWIDSIEELHPAGRLRKEVQG